MKHIFFWNKIFHFSKVIQPYHQMYHESSSIKGDWDKCYNQTSLQYDLTCCQHLSSHKTHGNITSNFLSWSRISFQIILYCFCFALKQGTCLLHHCQHHWIQLYEFHSSFYLYSFVYFIFYHMKPANRVAVTDKAESGSEHFFNTPAYLTVSGQLHLEAMAGWALWRVTEHSLDGSTITLLLTKIKPIWPSDSAPYMLTLTFRVL